MRLCLVLMLLYVWMDVCNFIYRSSTVICCMHAVSGVLEVLDVPAYLRITAFIVQDELGLVRLLLLVGLGG